MKKKHLLIPLFSFLFFNAAHAQSTHQVEVEKAVEQLRKAMVDADSATLAMLTLPELSYGHSSGLIEDKAAFVDDIVSGKSVFKTVSLEDQTIKLAGDVAIVRHHLMADTFNNNTAGKADLFVLLIWKKQKGQWKLLARQAAKVPAK